MTFRDILREVETMLYLWWNFVWNISVLQPDQVLKFCQMSEFILISCFRIWWNNSFDQKIIFLRFIKRFLTSLFRVCRFGAAHGGLGKFETTSSPFKVRRKYTTMIKNHTVIPYLKRIQKLYKFHNAYFKSCWHQQFFV